MTITSWGYPGTVTPGSAWAKAMNNAGRPWAFLEPTSFMPVANTSGTRLLDIQPGEMVAQGIGVSSSAVETVQVPEPGGASQWFLVTVRLWAADGETYKSQIEFIGGTTARSTPSRALTVGTEYHVPVALARVASDSGQVTDLVDLRVVAEYATGCVVVHSDLGLNLLSGWNGVIVYRSDKDTFYRRIGDALGGTSWDNESTRISALASAVITERAGFLFTGSIGSSDSGWTTSNAGVYPSRLTRKWGHVDMTLISKRTGGVIVANNTTGNVADTLVFTIASAYRPNTVISANATYVTTAGATASAQVFVYPNGKVVLTSLAAGLDMQRFSSSTDAYSLRVTGSWSTD